MSVCEKKIYNKKRTNEKTHVLTVLNTDFISYENSVHNLHEEKDRNSYIKGCRP